MVVIQAQFKALIDQVQALTDIFVWKSSQKVDQPQQLNIVMSEFCFIHFFFLSWMDFTLVLISSMTSFTKFRRHHIIIIFFYCDFLYGNIYMLVDVIMWLTSPTTLKNCSTHFGIQPGIKFLKLENEQQESLKLPFLLAAVNFDGSNHSFKIQLGPTGWLGIQSWNRAGLKKNRGRKNPVWPGGLT